MAAVGSISLDIHSEENSGYKEYFLKQNPVINKDKYFIKFWEDLFGCSLNESIIDEYARCAKNKLSEGKGYYRLTPVHTVLNAIQAVADALHILLDAVCKRDTKSGRTTCPVDARKRKRYSHHISMLLRRMAYNDGTLKSLKNNAIRYDIHYLKAINVNLLISHWENSEA